MERLAIVCGSPSSEMLAPFDDPNYHVWVLGNRCHKYPRFDLIFEIHDNLAEHPPEYISYLLEKEKPLVVGEKFPAESRLLTVYPYDAAAELIQGLYFTSSSACMLVYGLLLGYQHIELYGVDMAVDDHEYFWQRPNMEYVIGFARGRGVNVVIQDNSPLCKCEYVEGRDHGHEKPETPFAQNEYAELAEQHEAAKKRLAEEINKLAENQNRLEQLKTGYIAHDAAMQVYNRMAKVQRAVDAKQSINQLSDTVEMQ